MGPVSAIVLFAIVWFMLFLIILPIRIQTQGDLKDIVPGTHAGAPEHHHLGKKALWCTGLSILIWGFFVAVILSGAISVDNLENWFGRGAPAAATGTGG
jgi:predicted secreted protein